MLQDQSTQTANFNDSIVEQDNEQVLQEINGGGVPCLAVGMLSCVDAGVALGKVAQSGSRKELARAALYSIIAQKALRTASINPPICSECLNNITKYGIAKSATRAR